MSTALVTGCAGFIGSHVCRHLLAAGHHVLGIDDLSGGFQDNIPPAVRFYCNTITDERTLDMLFTHSDIDFVIHCAAYAAEGLSHFIRRFNYENNLIGSVTLINRAIRHTVKCFVFLSSIAVYGHGDPPFREGADLMPCDPYGIAKAAVEADLKAATALFGLPYIIFRPFNVYGPHQNLSDPYRNVIGIFMNQCMMHKPMTIFGDGEQTRAFSYIDDVAPVIARSIDRADTWGDVYNIGGENVYSINRLASLVGMQFPGTPATVHLPERNEVQHAFCDVAKVRAVFGARTTTSLVDGIARMAEWAKRRGPQPRSAFGRIEIDQKLPPSWAALR
jgi:UDP-glucose 4-epimerase